MNGPPVYRKDHSLGLDVLPKSSLALMLIGSGTRTGGPTPQKKPREQLNSQVYPDFHGRTVCIISVFVSTGKNE